MPTSDRRVCPECGQDLTYAVRAVGEGAWAVHQALHRQKMVHEKLARLRELVTDPNFSWTEATRLFNEVVEAL